MTIDLSSNVQSAKTAGSAKRALRTAKKVRAGGMPDAHGMRTRLIYGTFDGEARRQMIADAAYYLSAQRGFAPGHELDDWLAAEKEFDERLCGETHLF